jgi:hypothetical protein
MKLNINSTGAKPVFYHGEAIGKDILKAGTYMFVYDGTILNYGSNSEATTESYLNGIFVQDNDPTIFWNFTHNNTNSETSHQYHIFSLNHENQETIQESMLYFAKNFGSQKYY